MAQIEFYYNKNEWKELFEYLQINKSKLIPDVFYDTEQYYMISDFEEFIKYQEYKTVHFFLINDIFTLEPLIISLNRYTKEPKYKVNQRTGGPYIDISYYRGFAADAVIPYKATYLEYYPNFIHFNSSDEFKASDELKEYYLNLVKFVKKKCTVVKKGNKKYLIGHEVFKEIESLL
jgi:hypothetical protein